LAESLGRVRGRWRPNVMAVISDAFHLKQRVTEAFIRSKFIGPRASDAFWACAFVLFGLRINWTPFLPRTRLSRDKFIHWHMNVNTVLLLLLITGMIKWLASAAF
jgi:hypothetical protein